MQSSAMYLLNLSALFFDISMKKNTYNVTHHRVNIHFYSKKGLFIETVKEISK